MSNVSSSAILLIISVIIAAVIATFGLFIYHNSQSTSNTIYNKQVVTNENMKNAYLTDLEDKTFTGSGVVREIKMLSGNQNAGVSVTVIDSTGSNQLTIPVSTLKDSDLFQAAYQSARDSIDPDATYTATITCNSNGDITGVVFSEI